MGYMFLPLLLIADVYFTNQYKDRINDSSRWRGVSSSVGMTFISCVSLSDVCDDAAAGRHHQGAV